jgi:hypothetical protein
MRATLSSSLTSSFLLFLAVSSASNVRTLHSVVSKDLLNKFFSETFYNFFRALPCFWMPSTSHIAVVPFWMPFSDTNETHVVCMKWRNAFSDQPRTWKVSIAAGYGLDGGGVGVRVPVGSTISSPRCSDQLWGPPNLLSNGYLVLGIKR